MKIRNFIFVLLFVFPLFSTASPASKDTDHKVFFKNTPYELNVYTITGRNPGKTMLIIGGIQNEPAGYLSSDYFVDMKLEKGTMIVVPRANFNTIIQNARGVNGDMNRKFTSYKIGEDYDSRIVEILKSLMAESDILLNLHEGSGFFRSSYISDRLNPMRYGQSIIADSDIYTTGTDGKTIYLQQIAEEVIKQVNKKIVNQEFRFHFNNHNTFSKNTRHPEQRRSATYFALSNYGIPAFGIESSKDIKDIEVKVRHQVWIINEFMRLFDIIPENPRIYLEYPELKFIIVSINNNNPIMIPDKKTLYLNKGDEIEISHIESNYERGLSADILNYGTVNDYRSKITITRPTKIIVRKDEMKCGEIQIDFDENRNLKKKLLVDKYKDRFTHLGVEVNGVYKVFNRDERIDVTTGDHIKIIDTSPSSNGDDININLYGFIKDDGQNDKDDRNILIDAEKDLLPKFSKEGKGRQFDIRVEYDTNILSVFALNIVEPALEFVTIEHSGKKKQIKADQTLLCHKNDILKILDAKTNIYANRNIVVNFKGFVGRGNGEDRNIPIKLDNSLLKRYSLHQKGELYEITLSRNRVTFGRVLIRIVQ